MRYSRRQFNQLCGTAGFGLLAAPSISQAQDRPVLNLGCSSGDVSSEGAVIWSRTDRPSRLWVDVAPDPEFKAPIRFRGAAALQETDFNAKAVLQGLPAGQNWFYRVQMESLVNPGVFSESLSGQFSTAPAAGDESAPVCFCWSGDTAGQGYGIDTGRGGMQTYAAMLSHNPQFLVHSGDQIYADNPMSETLLLEDGTIWRNLLVEAKTRVAESTQDFRENFYYNFLDSNVRDFHARVPVYNQWDDHEVINNWYPGEQLQDDDRYSIKSASLLAEHSRRAMFDCNPLRIDATDPEQIYRVVHYGPLLDLFFLDLRSYRGPKSRNRQTETGDETAFMGDRQLQWLKSELKKSRATWKIICSDMPIGVWVTEWGTDIAENGANGDGPPLGRELEFAELLGFVQREEITNMHFITADVHYCASNHYAPERAVFKDFTPFWEFISGPLHAGTFAPSPLDNSFGPEMVFCGVPEDLPPNQPPSAGFQFFGKVEIDQDSKAMRVSHFNRDNRLLWQIELPAQETT